MRVTFVRHGQSTGNAGQPTDDLASMPLTELGWQQAGAVAASWPAAPAQWVTSPYLRARQTAEPSCGRFPATPLAVWPIQEFTYLEPSRWNGTSRAQRRPSVEAYWRRAQPDFVDGPGAESFSNVLRRAETALARLSAMGGATGATGADDTVLFSHGQFIQAVRLTVMFPGDSDAQKMARFWPLDQRAPVLNGQKVALVWAQGAWMLGEPLTELL